MRKTFHLELDIDASKTTGMFRFSAERKQSYQVRAPMDDVWDSMSVCKDVQTTAPKDVGPWRSFFISVAASVFAAGAIYVFGTLWPIF